MINRTQARNLMSEVTILLPTYNEEKSIAKVLDEIPASCKILMGDGISTDRTRHIARSKGVEPIKIYAKGKGSAIRELIKYVDTPYTIMVNADFTYPLSYSHTIYHLLSKSGADVVIGYRHVKEKDSMSFTNSLGNWLLSLSASVLYEKRVYDVCTGMWGFKTEVLKRFSLTSTHFTLEADLFVNSVRSKCRIEQIPVAYRARLEGSKAKLKVLDGFRIGWFLLRRRFKC